MKNVSARVCAHVCLAILSFTTPASAELIYGVAAIGNATALVTWDSATPSDLVSSQFITGLQPNETILGIDFRPAIAPATLNALGSSSRLYAVNVATGVASQVPAPGGPFLPPLNGLSFGVSHDPGNDTIRGVSDANANFQINPTTAARTNGPDLAYAVGDPNANVDPNVVHAAHSLGFYAIDSSLNVLAKESIVPGALNTIGPLGLDVDATGGFDVSSLSGIAYAALLPASTSVSQFYSINLATGAATPLGVIDGGLVVTAMAVGPAIPEPATLGLLGVAMIGCLTVRRRVG